jgi:hypothetical protein
MRAHLSWTSALAFVCLLGWPSDRIAGAQDELQTPQEKARYDKIVDEFIQYDVGQLRGEAGRAANARFQSLQNPRAIPSLVRGAINASQIRASCPIIMISSKLGGLLRSTKDPRLLQHALDYLKPTGPEAPYGTYLNNLRQIANEQYRKTTGQEPASPTELRGGGTASHLRRSRLQLDDWTCDDLAEAVSEVEGTELLQVLAELKDRKGSVYTEALADAVGTVDDDVKPIARGLLATRLTRMTDRTLKAKMKSSDAEVRAAAALAIGYKGSPLYRELAAAMRDGNLLVAQNGRDVLVKMLGEDLGPKEGAPGIEWYQASKRWEQWIEDWEKWVEHQSQPAGGNESPSEDQAEGQKPSSESPAEGQTPSSP